MAEMGHTDPGLALAINGQAMGRDEDQLEELRALVQGTDWAPAEHPDHLEVPAESSPDPAT